MKRSARAWGPAGIAFVAVLAGCSGPSGTLSAPDDLSFSYCVGVEGDSRNLVFGLPVTVDTAVEADYLLRGVELVEPVNAEVRATYVQVPGVPLPSAQDVAEFDATAADVSSLEGYTLTSDEAIAQILVEIEGTVSEAPAGFGGVRLSYESPKGQSKVLEIRAQVVFQASCDDDSGTSPT